MRAISPALRSFFAAIMECLIALTRARKRGPYQNEARWSRLICPRWLIGAYAVLARRCISKCAARCRSASCRWGGPCVMRSCGAELLAVREERHCNEQYPWLFVTMASHLLVSFAERRLQLHPAGWRQETSRSECASNIAEAHYTLMIRLSTSTKRALSILV